MKVKITCFLIFTLFLSNNLYAMDTGIHSLKIQEIIECYSGPIDILRKLDPDKETSNLSDNRVKINYLNRHIAALKIRIQSGISDHLKTIYRDSIIILYEELDKLQSSIITDNIRSIDELSIYLARFTNKKKSQDDLINDIGLRVGKLREVLNDLSETFDSYDRIIDKQNELITEAMDLNIEAYRNTIFLLPGLGAASNLDPYISLGLGYMASEGRFSYGGMLKAGFSPRQDIVNVGVSVLVGFGFGRIE